MTNENLKRKTMTRNEWTKSPKKKDPKFKGSIFEKLGHQNKLCPNCDAHLWENICLNACHLGDDGARRFSEHFREKIR